MSLSPNLGILNLKLVSIQLEPIATLISLYTVSIMANASFPFSSKNKNDLLKIIILAISLDI